VTFIGAIQSGFRNYVGFSGRAARSEFWYWFLFGVVISVVVALIDSVIAPDSDYGILAVLVALVLFLPGLAVTVRRLHDLDRSGWFILLYFVPVIGFVVLLVWFCRRGTIGPNRFGPDPLQASETLS
jgi:uncharacterized membrane protein YhaH (DUF805 family)